MIKPTAAALLAVAIAVAGAAQASVADDTLFDVAALSNTPLRAKSLKRVQRQGVITEEVRFLSETDAGKDVEIFAYFSYPRGAARLPAFIRNPGGLGQASTAYTGPEARRGYAVLCIDFPQRGYRSTGNYPINQELDLGPDPKRAPIAHGVVALLKAVSYLESRPEVDKNRIRMAGASWGGFFTTLMVGIDPRLKAGACLYGTGNLCFMKAEKPCTVTVQLGEKRQDFAVNSRWTQVALDFTPPKALMGVFPATIAIPPNATVLVDSIRFQPILPASQRPTHS